MAIGKSVQFRGISNVVKAYVNMDVPRWGLFQGNQFLMKYDGNEVSEGKQLLEDYLEALDLRSADGNTYTLCIYDNPAGKINSATKYDGSFNFRLVDNFDDHAQSRMSGVYEQRIKGLEDKITELTTEPEDEPEPSAMQNLWGAVGKILEHPQVQQALAGKILTLIDGVGDTITGIFKPVAKMRPAAIGTTTDVNAENAKLQEAVNILVKVDNQLGTHLLQLAKVAEADPKKYQSLISMLNLL
jgi:hypothetical protein